jgi:PAS domain S-box-containing protein
MRGIDRSFQSWILDSIADGVFTVDGEWRITSFNTAAERITGVRRGEAMGKRCCDVFRASICEGACALRQTLDTGKSIANQTVYIVDAHGRRVPISVSTAVLKNSEGRVIGGAETFRDMSQVEELRKKLQARYTFADLIGRSPAMQRLFELLPSVADSNSTVLLEGPSGTGKELVARAIHNLSPRQKKPLIAFNCAALPDSLLESELFGYKAGAFTDARKDKPGRFALAHGGTLFLDEIGDISAAMQTSLLRVLQERVFEPLGSVEPCKMDVRVIVATNRSLSQLVKEKTFRQDLFYRINVIRLELPSLKDRREDIPLLVEHFVSKFNRLQGKEVPGVTDQVLACLLAHDFPGNVRELENIIEHAFVLCRGGMIDFPHLPAQFRTVPTDPSQSLPTTLEGMERLMIADTLSRHHGNRTATARELGIDVSTLFRKIKSLGMESLGQDGRTRTPKSGILH